MTIEVLRAGAREARPWKNGGGLTWEIAAAPPGADLANFDWRLSLAMVEAGGPFSAFPGVDRVMLVLDGALELRIAGGAPLNLTDTSPAAEFPGDADVAAIQPAAPVADINLMVRRGRFTGVIERRRIAGQAAVICQDVTFVLARAGGLGVALAGERHELDAGDAVRVDHARGALLRLRPAAPDEVVIAHVNAVR
ncbi:MAG: HutD/Ves family protein [Caulobacteraceae bacterium]